MKTNQKNGKLCWIETRGHMAHDAEEIAKCIRIILCEWYRPDGGIKLYTDPDIIKVHFDGGMDPKIAHILLQNIEDHIQTNFQPFPLSKFKISMEIP